MGRMEREREGYIGVPGEKGRGAVRPRLQKPRVSNAEWTLFVREMTHCVHRAARGHTGKGAGEATPTCVHPPGCTRNRVYIHGGNV